MTRMDFKSPAYAIPPPGHRRCKPIPMSHLLQDSRWWGGTQEGPERPLASLFNAERQLPVKLRCRKGDNLQSSARRIGENFFSFGVLMCRKGTRQGDGVSVPAVKSLEPLKIVSSAHNSRSPIFGISLAHIETAGAQKWTEGGDERYQHSPKVPDSWLRNRNPVGT
jgi:hypothetical protein